MRRILTTPRYDAIDVTIWYLVGCSMYGSRWFAFAALVVWALGVWQVNRK